jgi:hypothetical protein
MTTKITFNPKQVTKKLLSVLPKRAQDILMKRYGLGQSPERSTLEAIGKTYGITRERVRQIEDYAIKSVRKSKEYKEIGSYFDELKDIIEELGGVISESELLEHTVKTSSLRNHVHFLLVLGDPFNKLKEDDHFTHRWAINIEHAKKIEDSIKKLYESLSNEDLVSEPDLIQQFLGHLKDLATKYKEEEIIKRWLRMSKKISRNPLGEWGRSDSPNINVKGIRDYAYLVIRKHGSPIHFKEVAGLISKVFEKKAHVATTHNELIKDNRFVLVGRGLYALSEWGYSNGVVREVIKDIIEKGGSLYKDEIVKKVMKERYVKENTIVVNLQNSKYFKKDKSGKYSLAN